MVGEDLSASVPSWQGYIVRLGRAVSVSLESRRKRLTASRVTHEYNIAWHNITAQEKTIGLDKCIFLRWMACLGREGWRWGALALDLCRISRVRDALTVFHCEKSEI